MKNAIKEEEMERLKEKIHSKVFEEFKKKSMNS